MIKLVLATLSENVVIDQQTNQVSVINMLEDIQAGNPLPLHYPKMTVMGVWERDSDRARDKPAQSRCRISLRSPSEASTLLGEMDVIIEPGKRRTRSIVSLMGVPIQEDGENRVIMQLQQGDKWKDVGFVPVVVTAPEA